MKVRRDYMFTHVRQWRESGLTRNEFCMQHGISLSKFSYWIARWKGKNRPLLRDRQGLSEMTGNRTGSCEAVECS